MPTYQLWLHPESKRDVRKAFEYYLARDSVVADRFEERVDQAVAKVLASPLSAVCFQPDIRRHLVNGFPQSLIYRVHDQQVQLLAVMHHKRHPDSWKGGLIDS